MVKSESLSDDMAIARAEISEQDLRDAGPSGLQARDAGASEGAERLADAISLVSTETIVHRNPPTPAHRNSQPKHQRSWDCK